MDGSLPGWRAPLCYCGLQILVFVFCRSRKSLPLPSKLCQQSRRCGERNHLPLSVCFCVCVCVFVRVPAWLWACVVKHILVHEIFFFVMDVAFPILIEPARCHHLFRSVMQGHARWRHELFKASNCTRVVIPPWDMLPVNKQGRIMAGLNWHCVCINVISSNHSSSYWLLMAIRAESSVITCLLRFESKWCLARCLLGVQPAGLTKVHLSTEWIKSFTHVNKKKQSLKSWSCERSYWVEKIES